MRASGGVYCMSGRSVLLVASQCIAQAIGVQ